jgi:hypothetical protein
VSNWLVSHHNIETPSHSLSHFAAAVYCIENFCESYSVERLICWNAHAMLDLLRRCFFCVHRGIFQSVCRLK